MIDRIALRMRRRYSRAMASCYSCGQVFPERMSVYRSSLCPSCGKDVKVCLNCRFYEPGAHWDCRETISEMVAEKDRANFCEYFVLSEKNRVARNTDAASRARSKLNDLFENG